MSVDTKLNKSDWDTASTRSAKLASGGGVIRTKDAAQQAPGTLLLQLALPCGAVCLPEAASPCQCWPCSRVVNGLRPCQDSHCAPLAGEALLVPSDLFLIVCLQQFLCFLSVSRSLSVWFFFFSLSVCLSLSVSHCLPLCLSDTVSVSVFLSVCLPFSVCLCPSCPSLSFSLCLCLRLSTFLTPCLSLSSSLSAFLCLFVCLCHSCPRPLISLSFSLRLSLPPSLPPSVFLSVSRSFSLPLGNVLSLLDTLLRKI